MIPQSKSFYKYKSLNNFEFILDLLLRERIYAGKYHELNDPMEGVIKLDGAIPKEHIHEWEQSLKKYNICSFTRDPENNLMWSHYADGGKGCLVEFELKPETEYSKVNYGKTPLIKANQMKSLDPKEVFLYKLKYWQYEKEFRCILTDQNYLPITVKSVLFGPRSDKTKVAFLIDILACCKPELTICRSGESSVIKSNPVKISHKANSVTFISRVEVEYSESCSECSRTEYARERLILRKSI
jgi:hypothetical protein